MIEEPSSIPGNGKRIFPPHAPTPALRPRTKETGDFTLSLNRLEREAILPFPCCAEVSNTCNYISTPLLLFMAWYLITNIKKIYFTCTDNLSFVKVWPLSLCSCLSVGGCDAVLQPTLLQALTWFLNHLLFKRRRVAIIDEIYELYCSYQ